MQKWEYKWVFRSRGGKYNKGMDDWNVDVTAVLPRFGDEGWELVSVVPRSSYPGDQWAGITSEELWVFKRPKQ